MSHRFVARATLGAGCGVRPDAHARNSSGGPWVPGSARPRSLSHGHQALASDVPPWMRDVPKRRRLDAGASHGAGSSHDHLLSRGADRHDPGAGGSRGAGSSPFLLSQGNGPRGVGVPPQWLHSRWQELV